jgi:hypothetical protein
MANSFESNFTRKLMDQILPAFDSNRVISKNVNTQMIGGKFNGKSGDNIDFPRPTDYVSTRTANGDISATTAGDIITGKATATVQDYITVELDYDEADEALKMGDKSRFFDDAGKRIKTDLETDFAAYAMKNAGLLSGTVGTAIDAWSDIANFGATMQATGVPEGQWCAAVNPYTQASLADVQRSLGAGGSAGSLVSEAHRQATIADNFAGMKVLAATTLGTYTTGTGADRAGTLSANPDVTYVTHKDSMQQSLAVTGFQANLVVAAGETITIAARNRLNLNTRNPIINGTGGQILFTGVVTESVTLNGSGAGTLVVSGPAIFEASGAYNTVDSAPISGDVVTLGGSATTTYQPALFWHRDAFGIGSVPMKKLNSTDTMAKTEDGLVLRVSMGTSIRENKQIVRLDLRPAFATLNPFFAGQGFGS